MFTLVNQHRKNAMIINTDLLVDNPEIIQGLLNGEMTRYGGVIRWAKGTEKAGQIVKHLTESSPLTYSIEKGLSQLMGLTQIAAGASVLNLGVSVLGFAYMGYQLHQVQKSLANILTALNEVDNRLNVISGQLAYLYVLVQDSRQKQESLAKAISNLQKATLIEKIATLNAELIELKRFPDTSPRHALKTASQVRLFLGSQAMQSTPALDAELMLNTDISIQGWAVATATEANLLLQMGEHQEAKQMLAEEVPKFQQTADLWGNELIADSEENLSTAYRFGASPFREHITDDRIDRIIRISPKDAALSDEQIRWNKNRAEVEFEMSYAPKKYDSDWIDRQIAIAEYLDTLSELTARLDTLQDFAALCERKEVKSSKELLPDETVKPGLYLLPT